MDDLQVMIIDLTSALESDDDTYVSGNDVFWDMVLDIKSKIPKENNKAYKHISYIFDELSFYTDQEEIIKELKEAYHDIYGENI